MLASSMYSWLSDTPLTLMGRDGWSENLDERSWSSVKSLGMEVAMAQSDNSLHIVVKKSYTPPH